MADGAAPTGDNQAPSGPRGDGNRGRGRGRGGRGRGRGDQSRGRGRGGGGRGGGAGHHHAGNAVATTDPASQEPKKAPNFKNKAEAADGEGDENAETCFICANPITHFSVAPCNHTTCHICSLRLRALYKSKDCPHCRTSSPYVIFTDDGTKRFEDYTNKDITSTDDNIGIKYAGEEIVGDTILLLRFNCPDSECDFAGLGWVDLHQHVRSVHNKKMCDLCTRNKKVFTHEHELFADKQITEHMRHGDDKPGAVDQTGFRGHPLCGFCGARFYDSDKLYEHCRNKHERCFLCDRRDSRQPHYFLDYDALEKHFKKDHFLCNDRECLEKKFVVFESEMDLKAHQLAEHGGSVGSGRDARRVDMSNFDLRQRYEQERGAPRGGRNQERRRAPDPANEPIPVSSAQPLRRDEIAFQRQMAIQSSAANRAPPAPAPTPGPSRPPPPAIAAARAAASAPIDAMENLSITDWSSLTQEQRASLARHNAVVERASNLLGNNENKIATFRQYISNFNRGSMNPTQLIDAFASLFADTSSDTALGTLVREVAELFEDKKKGEGLRAAWQNRKARTQDREEEYPSLPGLGGMHGATTSTTGWATAAAPTRVTLHNNGAAQQQRNSNRVLKLKNSTRRGSISNSSVMSFASASSGNAAGPSRAITSSPAAFPALPSAAARPAPAQQSSQPSWIGGSSGAPAAAAAAAAPRTTTASHVGSGARRGPPPQTGSSDAFPALPAAPKPKTTIFGYGRGVVRRDFGVSRDTGFSWGGAGGSGAGPSEESQQQQQQQQQEGQGGGKGKKNKKQVLAHWG
ncbi:putative zinc finger protein [Cercophora samala]|uniref:RING-type E3 ubiquitin transferase n=1 Tax=Cercophora samala TaxID=330535 RepID=A0AA39Z6T4_9PEZI|nr:putative zinc finger protein [Cercophora samala]